MSLAGNPVSEDDDDNNCPQGDGGVVVVLIINLAVAFLALLAFPFLRKPQRTQRPGRQPSHYSERQGLLPSASRPSRLRRTALAVFAGTWVEPLVRATDAEVEARAGPAATTYLHFVRNTAYLLLAFAVPGVAVLLPVNAASGERDGFCSTTAGNLTRETKQKALWVHVGAVYLFTALTMLHVLDLYRKVLRSRHAQRTTGATLMLDNLPRDLGSRNLRMLLDQLYPGFVLDVSVPFNLTKLMELRREFAEASLDLRRYRALAERGSRPMLPRAAVSISTLRCGRLCEQVPAIPATRDRLQRLQGEIDAEVDASHPACPVAFVTFTQPRIAAHCVHVFKYRRFSWIRERLRAGEAGHSRWWRWSVILAPEPSELLWENLHVGRGSRYLRSLSLNLLLFLLLTLLIAPIALLSSLLPISSAPGFERVLEYLVGWLGPTLSHILLAYIPTFLQFLLTWVVVPWMIRAVAQWKAFQTRLDYERSALTQNYVYLMFALLLLPSFLLTSVEALVRLSRNAGDDLFATLGQVFTNAGPFFVNYTLQLAITGNSFDLLRLPQWLVSKYRVWRAVIPEDYAAARSAGPFDYAYQYAISLAIFALTQFYSTMVPVIIPAGLVFFVYKYWVDKYNLLFVHHRSTTADPRIATTCVRAMCSCTLFFQAAVSGFFSLKGMFAQFLVVLSLAVATACFIAISLFYFHQADAGHSLDPILSCAWLTRRCLGVSSLPADKTASGSSSVGHNLSPAMQPGTLASRKHGPQHDVVMTSPGPMMPVFQQYLHPALSNEPLPTTGLP